MSLERGRRVTEEKNPAGNTSPGTNWASCILLVAVSLVLAGMSAMAVASSAKDERFWVVVVSFAALVAIFALVLLKPGKLTTVAWLVLVLGILIAGTAFQAQIAHWTFSEETFNLLVEKGYFSGDKAFYSFVLSALVLAGVIAGYLTYQSHKDARQEAETVKKDWEAFRKNAQTQFDEIKERWEEKSDDVDQWTGDAKQWLQDVKEFIPKEIADVSKEAERPKAGIREDGDRKAEMASRQMPEFGADEKRRAAVEAYNRGGDLYSIHVFDGAIADYRKDFDGAIAEYREALRLDPDFAAAHNNLGNALAKKKDFDGAIAKFEDALRLDPDLEAAKKNLEEALRKKKEADEKSE